MITRVSLDYSDDTYTAIKYDHHPHLFEIAFAYKTSLLDLEREVRTTLRAIADTANSLQLTATQLPVLELSPNDPRLKSELSQFKLLRGYRANLLAKRSIDPGSEASNYAAIIAATQTHIGGFNWWDNPAVVSQLYRYEPDVLEVCARLPGYTNTQSTTLLRRRWEGYQQVFSGYPLVGYPTLKTWTIESWSKALATSPLAMIPPPKDEERAALITNYPADYLSKVRDLQIIRPRLFGTLEFRADPAQPTPERVIAVAALRLGICIGVLRNNYMTTTFESAGNAWWEKVANGPTSSHKKLLDQVSHWLALRALGEENLLEPLYESELSCAA